MGSAALGEAISAIRDWSVTDAKERRTAKTADAFGSLVFNDEVQQARLPKPVASGERGQPAGQASRESCGGRSSA